MDIDTALREAVAIDGAFAVSIVDGDSGMTLGSIGSSDQFDLDVASAGNTEVVRAKKRTMESLGIKDQIDDILITLGGQYHIIRPLTSHTGVGLFIYLALDRKRANLAMARHRLKTIEGAMTF